MKTLKSILELYTPRAEDEQNFVKKHVVVKHADRNGNNDDLFKGKKVKYNKRKEERHGHDPEDGAAVYESLDEDVLGEGQDLQYGRKPKVVTKNYSWGKMKTIHKGADFSIPMHPEHHEPVSKLKDGESHHFTDETRTHWTATRSGDDVHFQSSVGKVKVPHKSLNEETLDEARTNDHYHAILTSAGFKKSSGLYRKNNDVVSIHNGKWRHTSNSTRDSSNAKVVGEGPSVGTLDNHMIKHGHIKEGTESLDEANYSAPKGTTIHINKPGHRLHGKPARVFHDFGNGSVNAQVTHSSKKGDISNFTLKPGEWHIKTKIQEDVDQLDEAVNPDDYIATHAKSQFGGYTPVVKHKTKGHTSYSGQARYKTPEGAKAHAEKYRKRMHYNDPAIGLDHTGDYEKLKEDAASEVLRAAAARQKLKGMEGKKKSQALIDKLTKKANAGKWSSQSYKLPDGRWASKDVKEDVDQIDELSNATLRNYSDAAKKDRYDRFTKEAPEEALTPKGKKVSVAWKRAHADRIAAGQRVLKNRNTGIKTAERKLEGVKEDVDQVDEARRGGNVPSHMYHKPSYVANPSERPGSHHTTPAQRKAARIRKALKQKDAN